MNRLKPELEERIPKELRIVLEFFEWLDSKTDKGEHNETK